MVLLRLSGGKISEEQAKKAIHFWRLGRLMFLDQSLLAFFDQDRCPAAHG